LQIKAPFDGMIGNWLFEQKTRIDKSQALLTVVDLRAFEAELAVPESYADELGLGMPVEIKVAGAQLQGELSAISPEVSDRQVITRVRFTEKIIPALRQNQRLSARIMLEQRPDVLMVKRGPFLQSGGGIGYRVEENIASRTQIQTGSTSLNHVEIITGLQEGDRIIISSIETFKNADNILLK